MGGIRSGETGGYIGDFWTLCLAFKNLKVPLGMAKKKNKSKNQTALSPKAYLLKGMARKLPIHSCWVTKNWEKVKKINVIVSRQHVNGNFTVGFFLVDLLCTGVKDSFFRINVTPAEFSMLMERLRNEEATIDTCSYELAHNIIYEGLEYASGLGIDPSADFALSSLILEEDSDDIPLIDIPLGEGGKPLLILHPGDKRNTYYQQQIENRLKPGEYHIVTSGEGDDWDDSSEDLSVHDFSTWSYQDWEFYLDTYERPKRPQDIDIQIIEHIYRNCIYSLADSETIRKMEKSYALPETVEIAYSPMDEEKYSPEELDLISDSWERLFNSQPSDNELRSIKSNLVDAQKKWPGNPIIRNHLSNALLMLNELDLAEKLINETLVDFPDYLSAKIMKCNLLLEQGKLKEIAALLEGVKSLADFSPKRSKFHVTELINFYSLICLFHLRRGDLRDAYLCFQLATIEEGSAGTSLISREIISLVLGQAVDQVGQLIEHIQSGKVEKKPIIELLMQETYSFDHLNTFHSK
jgi:hypothetical protein